MSVLSVDVVDWTGTNTEDYQREYTLTYRVVTDSVSDGPAVVLAATGLPAYGDYYQYGNDYDGYAFCRFVGNAKRDQSDAGRKTWFVEAKYSTKGTDRDPQDKPGDPLNWGWKVSGSFGSGTRLVDKDADGRANVNSADEPFEPAAEIDSPSLVLQLEKNTLTIDVEQWSSFAGKVNEDPLWGLDARCVKLKRWDWSIAYTGTGQAYIVNKFEVEVNEDGFYFEPMDVGTRTKDGAGGYTPILIKGEIPSKPQYLDGAGGLKDEADPVVYFDGIGGNPEPYKLEREADFSKIFPATLPFPII